jgi:hypothetical protein
MAGDYSSQLIESTAEIMKTMIEKGFVSDTPEICSKIKEIKKALHEDVRDSLHGKHGA